MQSFEIQVFNGGNWKMDSVFDDRETCIEEAKRAAQSGRYSGLRVVEENYDESTNKVACRILYRGGTAKAEKARADANRKLKPPRPTAAGGQEPHRIPGRPRKKKNSSLLVPVLLLIVVILGGVIALLAMRQL
jgi:hypothetical protein